MNIHVLRGFEPAIPAIKQFQTYALECRVNLFFFFKDLFQRKYVQYSAVCSTKDDAVTAD
jgi:hypothetical protein